MVQSIDYRDLAPDAVAALEDLESAIESAAISDALVELVKLRASQINGCAYCVDMHTRRAGELGLEDRRVAAVAAWQESPFFDRRERAALQLTEALSRLSEETPDERIFEDAREEFDDDTLASLVMTINAINCWNRLWVSFRTPEIPELAHE